MSAKIHRAAHRCATKAAASSSAKRHCLVFFPLEGSHGIWPEDLIRPKGRFAFEAKYGKEWFECRIDKEGMFPIACCSISQRSLLGTMAECQSAQHHLEKSGSGNEKQWSSAETELSDNDEDSSDENNVC